MTAESEEPELPEPEPEPASVTVVEINNREENVQPGEIVVSLMVEETEVLPLVEESAVEPLGETEVIVHSTEEPTPEVGEVSEIPDESPEATRRLEQEEEASLSLLRAPGEFEAFLGNKFEMQCSHGVSR